MRPVIVFPDAETAIVTFLTAHLPGTVTVSTRVPNPIPTPYIQVRRSGGNSDSWVLDKPRFDLRTWADSETEAIDVALLAHATLLAISNDTVGNALLYAANDFLTPTQFPDPADPTRTTVMSSVEVVLRGVQV